MAERVISVGGDYERLEIVTDAQLAEEAAQRDEWEELPTMKTELVWPPSEALPNPFACLGPCGRVTANLSGVCVSCRNLGRTIGGRP